ncbi:hypothetical protein dsx2_1060 [Desulfovibrio sp. X2]|uniref:hypothetical protein n=1 Tax=Desulfovibrio sp. X2 TaxID=941449 RepID=UPI000358CEE1|nr:hypothetical protein [Desulfovibrio sp. X2]EPR37117.1 hypothetical protein dsx2_1060 [Desulfovibrio sp. X2]
MAGLVAYAFWEIALLLSGIAVALWCFQGKRRPDDLVDFWLVALTGKIFLGCLVPQMLVLTKCLSQFSLLTLACIASATGLAMCRRHAAALRAAFLPSKSLLAAAWPHALLIIGAILFSTSITPLLEVDSLKAADSLFRALVNSASLFDFPYHYVAFWEMGYIPGLLLGGKTFYYPFFSVQAIVLFVLATYAVSRKLGATRLLCALLALSALLCGHFWTIAPTGAATLKNDIIHAAGTLLMLYAALRALQDDILDRHLAVLAAGGMAFAGTKFSGLPIAFVLLAMLLALKPSLLRAFARRKLQIALVLGALFTSSGIYYAHNLFSYGNPLYPFALKLGPLHLHGRIHVEKTKITDYLLKAQTWRYFLGLPLALRASGMLFPFVFLASIFITPLAFARSTLRRLKDNPLLVAWLFTVFLWAYFFCMPWSAGSGAKAPYAYLAEGYSLRYALAGLQLSLVVVCIALQRMGWLGAVLAYALAIGDIAARYAFLTSWMPFYEPGIWAYVAIVAALWTVIFKLRSGLALSLLASFCCGLLLAPAAYDHFQFRLLGTQYYAVDEYPHGAAYRTARNLVWEPGDGISTRSGENPPATAGSGSQFEYRGTVSLRQAGAGLVPGGKPADVLVAASLHEATFTRDDIILMQRELRPGGYVLVAPRIYPWSINFGHPSYGASGSGVQHVHPWSLVFFRAVAATSGKAPPAEPIPVMDGFPHSLFTAHPSVPATATGGYFATIFPAGLWRLADGRLVAVRTPPGTPISLYRPSSGGRPGQAAPFVLDDDGWSVAPDAPASALFTKRLPLLKDGALDTDAWFVTGVGGYASRVVASGGRPALEISEHEDQPWVGLFTRPGIGGSGPGRYLLYVEATANRDLTLDLHGSSHSADGEVEENPYVGITVSAQSGGSGWLMFDSSDSPKNAIGITWQGHAGDAVVLHKVLLFKTDWPLGMGAEKKLLHEDDNG